MGWRTCGEGCRRGFESSRRILGKGLNLRSRRLRSRLSSSCGLLDGQILDLEMLETLGDRRFECTEESREAMLGLLCQLWEKDTWHGAVGALSFLCYHYLL